MSLVALQITNDKSHSKTATAVVAQGAHKKVSVKQFDVYLPILQQKLAPEILVTKRTIAQHQAVEQNNDFTTDVAQSEIESTGFFDAGEQKFNTSMVFTKPGTNNSSADINKIESDLKKAYPIIEPDSLTQMTMRHEMWHSTLGAQRIERAEQILFEVENEMANRSRRSFGKNLKEGFKQFKRVIAN